MSRNKYDFGDLIQVNTDKETFSGYLIPSINQDTLVIKLNSGYNIGIKKIK